MALAVMKGRPTSIVKRSSILPYSPPGLNEDIGDLAVDAVCGAQHFADTMKGATIGFFLGGLAGLALGIFVRVGR